MRLRAAHPSEAEALSALAMRAKAHWGYAPETLASWKDELRISAADISSKLTFAGVAGEEVVGFYSLSPGETDWELDNLWVAPEHMKRGYGRALLDHALARARQGGATAVIVDSDPNAESFYAECGAVRVGQVAAPIAGHPHRVRPQMRFSIAYVPLAFSTARLVMRRPKARDADAVFEYASDPEVTRYMDWKTHTGKGESLDFSERSNARWASGEEYTWVITEAPSDVAIGALSCRFRSGTVDFGYVLNRRCWGRGLATEAARAIVDRLFSLDAVERVTATCDTENVRSARVLEKAGLRLEGLVPSGMVRPNLSPDPRDACFFAASRITPGKRSPP